MHSYFAEICRGIEAHARPAGYQNLICSTDEEPRKDVSWSKAEMGQAAASLLLELIDGTKKGRRNKTITVPPELLIRQSSGHG